MAQGDDLDWEKVERRRARLQAAKAALKEELQQIESAIKALPKRPRGRPKGHLVESPEVDGNHKATRRALSHIQRFQHQQKKLGRASRVPKATMNDFIERACAEFPAANQERVRELVNRHRKSGELKDFGRRGPIKRLIGDYDD
ncbi:hypothetical protein AB8Z38_22175 [Bradyrhizobium sp. LLZ17]|uniref:Transposase n=1 Tax=Bradyrhizobium sp. LLZ17 TaxID=3239388 RepID=A0AB39XCA9_9BRAD